VVAGTGAAYSYTTGNRIEWGTTIETVGQSFGSWTGTNNQTFVFSETGFYYVNTSMSVSTNVITDFLLYESTSFTNVITGVQGGRSNTYAKFSVGALSYITVAGQSLFASQGNNKRLLEREIRIHKL
jgi:hypothetical protein